MSQKNVWPLVFGLLLILFSWTLCWTIAAQLGVEISGPLGDTFGIVNSLFSAMTLLAAGTAVYLQHQELSEARRNIHSSEIESRFNSAFNLFQQVLASTEHIHNGTRYHGRIALLREYERLKAYMLLHSLVLNSKAFDAFDIEATKEIRAAFGFDQNQNSFQSIPEEIVGIQYKALDKYIHPAAQKQANRQYMTGNEVSAYRQFYNDALPRIGSYFSSLISLLKFIENSKCDDNDKHFYFGQIASHLSTQEKLLLVYHAHACLQDEEKELIKKSSILGGLRKQDFIHDIHAAYGAVS